MKNLFLASTLNKKIEDKTIVWFENSNQYLVLEPLVADIVTDLSENKNLDIIADKLENNLEIPLKLAKDFIKDINDKILKPNIIPLKKKSENCYHKIPETFLFIKYYQINSKVFKVFFSNEFELSLIHPKFAHLEVPEVSEIDFIFQVFNNSKDTYLIVDSVVIGNWSPEDIHYFQGKFSMKIIECVYEKGEENWMGVFHASAVNYNDNAILILGDSGNGKSTSLALLQAQGFHCVADDFVPIDTTTKIHAFPAGISIKKNSLPVLLKDYPELKSSAEYHYTRLNKTVRYLPPKNINYQKKHPCKAFVFIKYDSTTEFEITKISSTKAFENLVPDSWISSIPKNVSIFLNWFEKLPSYQITYSNNEMMYKSIKNIFEDEL